MDERHPDLIVHYLSKLGCTKIPIDFNQEKYNRDTSNAELEKFIEAGWAEKLKKNPKLWNGSKFRLAGTEKAVNPEDATDETFRKLKLGITGYKDLFFTHYNPPDNKRLEYQFLGNPLGVASLMICKDNQGVYNKAIFLKRAAWLGENPNMFDVPGGHAEPSHIEKKNLEFTEENVCYELFDSQVQEIVEETATDISLIESHKLHGIFGLPPSRRPVSYFITYVNKKADDVIAAFNKENDDKAEMARDESSFLFYKDLSELDDFFRNGDNVCTNGLFAIGTYLYKVGEITEEDFLKTVSARGVMVV